MLKLFYNFPLDIESGNLLVDQLKIRLNDMIYPRENKLVNEIEYFKQI